MIKALSLQGINNLNHWWNTKSDQKQGQPGISRSTIYKAAAVGLCFILVCGFLVTCARAQPSPAVKCGADGLYESLSDSIPSGIEQPCGVGEPYRLIPESFKPYEAALAGRVTVADADSVLTKFPPRLSSIPYPELMSNSLGNRMCSIERGVPSIETCDSVSELIEEGVKDVFPQEYAKKIAEGIGFREKGDPYILQRDYGGNIAKIHLDHNPQKLVNHQNVLTYLEENVLQNEDFLKKSPEDFLKTVKKTHEIYGLKLPNRAEILPGKFRVSHSFVTEELSFEKPVYEQFVEILTKNRAKPKYFARFKNIWEKTRSHSRLMDAIPDMTKAEIEVMKIIGLLPPAPEQIEGEMLKFASDFLELGKQVKEKKANAVAAASWAHAQIGVIHPFQDQNGRSARGWMNVMLQLGGYRGVAFPIDKLYTEQVQVDQKTPGSFVNYLLEVIQWNANQTELKA